MERRIENGVIERWSVRRERMSEREKGQWGGSRWNDRQIEGMT